MKRAMIILAILMVLFADAAYAGILGKARTWLTGEVVALALSVVLTILGGALGLAFRRISRTFKEAGEFMTTLGIALEDKRLTREELTGIIKEGKDIFAVWE